MRQQQTAAGQAPATAATNDPVAQSALEVAEQALQAVRSRRVPVTPLGDRLPISIPSSDGTRRRIERSADGASLLSVDGISTQAIMPPPVTSRKRDLLDNLIPLLGIICGMVAITTIFGPIMKALGQRMEKREATLPNEAIQRLAGIERAVDMVAVEVERIREGQRFTSKLLVERPKVGAEWR
jgi:hypothetical protein